MATTSIEWVQGDDGTPGESWNPTRGCDRVDEGCRNCFAEGIAARFSGDGQPYHGLAEMTPSGPRWTRRVLYLPDRLLAPLKWKKPRRVFVNSMSDLFHEKIPDRFIAATFAVMAATPQHTYIILTKRTDRALAWFRWIEGHGHINGTGVTIRQACRRYLTSVGVAAAGGEEKSHARAPYADAYRRKVPEDVRTEWPLDNVWLVASVHDQEAAEKRVPELIQCSAAVRGISYEPALGQVNFRKIRRRGVGLHGADDTHGAFGSWQTDDGALVRGIDWVIAGAESGSGARGADLEWFRDVRDQCRRAGVPFFLKQIPKEGGPRGHVVKEPELDGVQHVEWPA